MSNSCPQCGSPASGNFCAQCGGTLNPVHKCGSCGNTVPAGGRFCNMCGSPVAAESASPQGATVKTSPAGGGGDRNAFVPWAIAGAALLALVVAIVGPQFASDAAPTAAPPITGPAAPNPGAVDLESMTPQEAANRLFNRVMTSASAGDTAEARAFAPMAIAAYERAQPLDLDGLYHVAVLQLINDESAAARETTERILAEAPNHLFGLFTAAQSESLLGNDAAAVEFYRRFLENYDAEIALDRPEYSDHVALLPSMREEARQAVG